MRKPNLFELEEKEAPAPAVIQLGPGEMQIGGTTWKIEGGHIEPGKEIRLGKATLVAFSE